MPAVVSSTILPPGSFVFGSDSLRPSPRRKCRSGVDWVLCLVAGGIEPGNPSQIIRDEGRAAAAAARSADLDVAKIAAKQSCASSAQDLGPLLHSYRKRKKAYGNLQGTADGKTEATAQKAYHDARIVVPPVPQTTVTHIARSARAPASASSPRPALSSRVKAPSSLVESRLPAIDTRSTLDS